MSEFTILYKSLHCEQKAPKKAEQHVSSAKSGAKSEAIINPFRTLIAKIF